MNSIFVHIQIVLPSLILSNVLHMLAVKYNFLPFLKVPISVQYFGENKTWRGFFLIPIVNSILLSILSLVVPLDLKHPIIMGMELGFAYVIFELPNSFIKRKLGIHSGKQAQKNKLLFMAMDKMDSAFGVTLLYYFIQPIDLAKAFTIFLICVSSHVLFSFILVKTKIKSSF